MVKMDCFEAIWLRYGRYMACARTRVAVGRVSTRGSLGLTHSWQPMGPNPKMNPIHGVEPKIIR